jgi:hypothetical protein
VRKDSTFLERIFSLFGVKVEHHRFCRKCKKRIKRNHHWHQVQVGWFAPAFCLEHWDCESPQKQTPHQLAQRLGPELPFEVIGGCRVPRLDSEDVA